MAKTVNIEIDEQGNFSVDLTGFHGRGCSEVAKAFESLGTVTKSAKKPEWNQVTTNLQTK